MKYVWRGVPGLMLISGLAIFAGGVWFVLETANAKQVPEGQWSCVDQFGNGYDVVWDAKYPGTNIFVESARRLELFGLSCLANPKSNCFDNDGWFGATIVVSGPGVPTPFSITRNSADIDDQYRHHVDLVGNLADSVIAAFRTGTSAEVTTLGRKGEVLKVTKIGLGGFGAEMDKCLAIWATK